MPRIAFRAALNDGCWDKYLGLHPTALAISLLVHSGCWERTPIAAAILEAFGFLDGSLSFGGDWAAPLISAAAKAPSLSLAILLARTSSWCNFLSSLVLSRRFIRRRPFDMNGQFSVKRTI